MTDIGPYRIDAKGLSVLKAPAGQQDGELYYERPCSLFAPPMPPAGNCIDQAA